MQDILSAMRETAKALPALIREIEAHEGFEGDRYLDSLGKPHIGFGCLLPLTEDEARLLLLARLAEKRRQLRVEIAGWDSLPRHFRVGLVMMSYQLGARGVSRSKHLSLIHI